MFGAITDWAKAGHVKQARAANRISLKNFAGIGWYLLAPR